MSRLRTDIVNKTPNQTPTDSISARPMKPAIARALTVAVVALLASMLASALHDVSRAWDVGYYHLPFAARLVGILPGDVFVFHTANEARFAGFPLLGELIQGALWRLTGWPQATNLVAFAAVPLVAFFLRRRFGVPWFLGAIALLGIPLVQIHATSSYVDLPANAAAGVLVLLVIDAYATPDTPRLRWLVLAFVMAAIAVNMKALLHPIVALALVALTLRIAPSLVRALRGSNGAKARSRAALGILAIVLAAPIIFTTPLKNAALYGNPYYPVRVHVLGRDLPGPEDPYSSSPDWLESSPRPLRFAASILELGVRPMTDPRRWTVDQWMPSDAPGYRMGGFFGAYVVAMLALLAFRLARDRSRTARVAGGGFAALTLVTSFMPQSHELRYYMVWMIVLVAINVWLACRPQAAALGLGPTAMALVATGSLIVVLAVSRGGYAYPSGTSFTDLVREQVDPRVVDKIANGAGICVDRAPWNVLWAAPFHAPKTYVVKEAETPDECAGYWPINP